jgi:hypothetical protein
LIDLALDTLGDSIRNSTIRAGCSNRSHARVLETVRYSYGEYEELYHSSIKEKKKKQKERG